MVPPVAPSGRRRQAITAEILARAKAVCGFNFHSSNTKWREISLEMKMEACIQLALEFKEEDWAIGRIGSLYRCMLKWIVDDKHRVTVADDRDDDGTVERNPRYASCSSVVHSFLTDARDSAAAGHFVDLEGDTMFEMAMTPANLERAKAVCEIEFSGRHRGSKTLTHEMKMEACIQMALEFQEEVWATRKMGPVIISMLNRVVEGIDGSAPHSKAALASARSQGTVANTYVPGMNEQHLPRANTYVPAMNEQHLPIANAVSGIDGSAPHSKAACAIARSQGTVANTYVPAMNEQRLPRANTYVPAMNEQHLPSANAVHGTDGSAPHSKAARAIARSQGTVANTYVPAMNEQHLPRANAVHGTDGSAPHSKAARRSARRKGTVTNMYVQAMNEQNLARAKAVCGLNFDGPPRIWLQLTLAEQTKALWELGLEFKDDGWARGRMGGIFREMITRILDDHYRNLDQIQEPNHTMDTGRNAINEKAHTVVANQPWGFPDPRR
jgi:hypothetical protein